MRRSLRTPLDLAFSALTALTALTVLVPSALAQQDGVYRTVTAQAAPGQLLELIELYREQRVLYRSVGEAAPHWMRHSQGDQWDLFLLYPIPELHDAFAPERAQRIAEARTESGRTGEELARAIDALTVWREEVFVRGPAHQIVAEQWEGTGLFHLEMFEGLAGKREELVRQREMENRYLVDTGRRANLVFRRLAGAATDVFTLGFYRDLQHYAEPSPVDGDEADRIARAAGFEGSGFIGSYLRELLLRHHDTLGVRIPG